MFKKYGFFIFTFLLLAYFVGKYFYMQPKYINGEMAAPFSAMTTLSGNPLSLEDLKGNYVLLDFWGTWCMPCRKEFPDLKKMHQTYHGKQFKDADNFHIVSIALEKEGSEERWKRTIEKSGLVWENHIFDGITNFKFLDAPISSELYGVKEVPTKYLINQRGEIMGVNLPFEEMNAMLSKRLK